MRSIAVILRLQGDEPAHAREGGSWDACAENG